MIVIVLVLVKLSNNDEPQPHEPALGDGAETRVADGVAPEAHDLQVFTLWFLSKSRNNKTSHVVILFMFTLISLCLCL